ncbi:cryptochrome/photolyase family protein, partial [Streptomyces rochei]
RFHRAKAHLVLSAMRHRAAELGDRVRYVQSETYADGLAEAGFDGRGNRLTVCHPTSRAALDFVTARDEVDVLPARGFLLPRAEFEA